MVKKLIQTFQKIYGDYGALRTYFAPGRVNLIGEHTDYNGGHVFPCALTLGTYAVVRSREDYLLRFYSMNFADSGIIESSLEQLTPDKSWADYPKGVMWTFEQRGLHLTHGLDIAIYGDIPNGSGLSSSASLEVLTGLILKDTFGFDCITAQDLALIGQYSENHFNGMNCGIMDQFASAMGKRDCAIFLDTNTLDYQYAPIKLENAKIVITNSNVKHSLVDSAYNQRRQECETALKELQSVTDIQSLCQLSVTDFEQYKSHIKDSVCRRRAKHAIYENQRTILAVQALKSNNIAEFGKLMNDSHISLRDDYEVSCEEIDILVNLAWQLSGVIGSRITGGGFGGCTVSLVKNNAIDSFIETVGNKYTALSGHHASFYIVEIGDGAYRINTKY